jgi:hypothetical protein
LRVKIHVRYCLATCIRRHIAVLFEGLSSILFSRISPTGVPALRLTRRSAGRKVTRSVNASSRCRRTRRRPRRSSTARPPRTRARASRPARPPPSASPWRTSDNSSPSATWTTYVLQHTSTPPFPAPSPLGLVQHLSTVHPRSRIILIMPPV